MHIITLLMIMVEMTLAFLQYWPLTRLRRGSGRFDEDSVGPRDRKLPGCWKSVEQATYAIIVKHEEDLKGGGIGVDTNCSVFHL